MRKGSFYLDQILDKVSLERVPVFLRHYQDIESVLQDYYFEFENQGDILEAITLKQLRDEFPAHEYTVLSGANYRLYWKDKYGKMDSTSKGELDFVVIRNSDDVVIRVGEAKSNIAEGLEIAVEQKQRFLDYLEEVGRYRLIDLQTDKCRYSFTVR
jgi:hypothetical protein